MDLERTFILLSLIHILGSITNSFSMQINRRTNPGTPRGAGNLRGEDIEKISQVEGITSSIKRINAIADILDHEIIETEETCLLYTSRCV